ncbi:peroxisome assembly protein (Peroxin-2) [Ophidiomyces ophidiicola]|uniref:Peroxisome assembly protein (Peroxin-2) n=1 Tax=Ophidiomyces ophidiicola TaxID=1387563 RepID=A0ACB8UQ71_9EURO|nr:peroxisome assembly protein (Peroxin-2) [Ophidiomyces ophidiicola]KAI1908260.1 peroxisome assembly protein (Peroxin-2) [Ophidiomyces ophidiicola]KAI1923182.1 peroxisome assembly protein (Peroxin-2) [Ophidiomyces ophidiicola]KAI1951298.1 peroxisome assembly protein (Peroxin-2) [Ophidiomyces ophidiicola]KAI1968679.1 peroxisome assembly protein (Peroxin-2) [Ophidiomyces ophidiicola]
MTSANFAAAQARVLERHQQRETEAQNNRLRPSSRLPPALRDLPYPLGRLSGSSLALWDTVKGREGTRPAFRVGQVDSELLDEELLGLLKGQVGEGLKYLGRHIREDWSHEIELSLRAILFKLSIWDHDASYGAALQNLKYTDSRSKGPVYKAPTKWQKVLYGLLTVGGRYAWDKWDSWIIDQEGGYEEASPNLKALAKLTNHASNVHSMASFASFLVFLVNGRYRTLVDRLLRMRLTPPSTQVSREVSFEYLNRQLVWHAFTEFLLFLLPLVGIGRWRRWLSRAWKKTVSSLRPKDEGEEDAKDKGPLGFLPERTCAICYQNQNPTTSSESDIMAVSGASGGIVGSAQTDITNPYEAVPCGCIYCFVCIAQRLEAEEGEGWMCLRCGEVSKQCKAWNGDVLEEVQPQSTSGKNVGFVTNEDVDSDSHTNDSVTDDGMHESNQWATVGKDETDNTSVELDFDHKE